METGPDGRRPRVPPPRRHAHRRTEPAGVHRVRGGPSAPAVESIPGKVKRRLGVQGHTAPVATIIENVEDLSVDEVMEQFGVTRERITAVLTTRVRGSTLARRLPVTTT
jgi:uncharacterized protein (DUF433 family)